MSCIRCRAEIPINNCFCDVCEMVGCGCPIQPPIEEYINEDGPYCPVCAQEIRNELSSKGT